MELIIPNSRKLLVNAYSTRFYIILRKLVFAVFEVTFCRFKDQIKTNVVEEIVRRGGTFYTGTEAKPIVPWDMVYTDVCAASCKWLDGESRPKNPAYAEQNWLLVDIAQYMYGKYLQAKISEGTLGIEQLSENRNS